MTPSTGLTLIELVLVLALVGITAGLAYPKYDEHLRQTRRTEAQTVLLELAHHLERGYAQSNRYDQDLSGTPTQLPYQQIPTNPTQTAYYQLHFAEGTPSAMTYTLQAVPTGIMASDRCGILSLNQQGVQMPSAATGASCWRR